MLRMKAVVEGVGVRRGIAGTKLAVVVVVGVGTPGSARGY